MKHRQTSQTKAARRANEFPSQSAADESLATESLPSIVGSVLSRQELIATEAYFRAERRGFAPGCELDDWLAAEALVDSLNRQAPGNPNAAEPPVPNKE